MDGRTDGRTHALDGRRDGWMNECRGGFNVSASKPACLNMSKRRGSDENV